MNCSQAPTLILLGLSSDAEKWQPLFSIFLVIYLLGLLGNLLLLLAIGTDVHLHTPMYFFLSQLSFVDLCFITTTAPKMLEALWTGDGSISFSGCLTQLYFFAVFADMDNLLLAVMAIDRYAAICHPLRYSALMTPFRCGVLVSGSWGVTNCVSLTHTLLLSKLYFHTNQEIPHFFCEFGPLLLLSCSDTHLNKILVIILVGILGISAVLCIVSSYGCIFYAVAKVPSAQGKRKALSTCSSHLSVVLLFYSTVFATYLKPPSSSRSSEEVVAAVMYSLVTPTLNPFIYSLRNKDVKSSLRRILNME
ncbi:olfactory receptor 99 [Mus musculus]|jgi:olfactory receptor|uniref:Olfactory receptor n=1 Tax=Mus musculus TaxID=10090 RepID=Q8VFE4_MOUSE|nr:olfactory receptor 99 [Mus musculus]AAI06779.1 Olfactory receptor 99 [Mus musculus]AAL61245.1 olfactory receptor MOR156-1 [Mus musculus]AAP71221.1 olfactory receptor Olfr99 [Mus musculus]EDL23337.1 mCG58978 [Mus musculus]|eukprot:NP_666726.1 olfactory receptor 99 [Mus musculus]